MSQAAYIQDMITESVEDLGTSEVVNFYNEKNVLITGGTGFLGLLLTERILRSCSGIKKLFLIIRGKKGKNPQERIDRLFDDVIFERLKSEKPGFARKVVLIEGDMGLIGLGLSPEQRELLKSTNIVIHSAATVRFDESLRTATNINVRGTKELLSLAKEMVDLKVFVHISTAYSHCVSKVVEEKFYPSPIDSEKLFNLLDILDDSSLNHLTPVLLKKWPNTYTFTKAVAEDVIRKNCDSLPLCIVRPSVVVATAKEPIVGWVNNFTGATGIVAGAGVGLLHTLYCLPDGVGDLIPADYVVNNVIAASWNVAKTRSLDENGDDTSVSSEIERCPIYNITSSSQRPITWRELMQYTEKHGRCIPSMLTMSFYSLTLNKYRWVDQLYSIFLHLIPAVVIDTILRLTGRKPILWAAYRKIAKFITIGGYFALQEWHFTNYNVRKLLRELSPADRTQFDFNIEDLNWDDYSYGHIRGLRAYLLKDPLTTVPQARVKYNKVASAQYALQIIVFSTLIWLLWTLLRFIC